MPTAVTHLAHRTLDLITISLIDVHRDHVPSEGQWILQY